MSRTLCPLRSAVLGGVVLLALQACQDVSITAVDVASLEVSPEEGSLRAGETLQLGVTLRDADGNVLDARPVAWSSEDAAVAEVRDDGLVEARGAGETRIRAVAGTAEATATITVRELPAIEVDEAELRFERTTGQGSTPYDTVRVTASGGDTVSGLSLTVHYASGGPGGWLDASLQGSTTPTTFRARAREQGLDAGVYEAEIRLDADGAAAPRAVRVVLVVDAPAPSIRLSTATVAFERTEGQAPPSPRTVEITNDGGGSLTGLQVSVDYVSGQGNWLDANLGSSSAPTELALAVSSASRPAGTYRATVRVSSPVADNSPRSLTVELRVRAPGVSTSRSDVTASPGEIPADGESRSTVTVQLRDASGNAIAPSGASVTLSTTRGTLGSVSGHGGGRYTAQLTASTSAGEARITARVDGETLDERPTVRFAAVNEPSQGVMRVASITYHTDGGPDNNRHLRITVLVVDGAGDPVGGAHVTGLARNTSLNTQGERAGTTGSDGRVVFGVSNFRHGCYETDIHSVSKPGVEWDEVTPQNRFCSESD